MTIDDVQTFTENEIGTRWHETNDHNVDLQKSLTTPRHVECRNTFPQPDAPKPPVLQMWLVLEETPGSQDGYVILGNLDCSRFGLGCWDNNGKVVFLGYHGSFWNAFQGM